MKSLICIMAHKEAQDTFNRHLPIWKALGADMIVACPANSKVQFPEKGYILQRLDVGKAEHTGMQSIIRIRTVLEGLLQPGYDRYAFFEYDAIAFDWPDPIFPIAAPIFRDNNPNRGFTGTMFTHPPLFFNPHGLHKLVQEMQEMPVTEERCVWDRYVGLAIERSGISAFDMLEAGHAFADNTIHRDRYGALTRAVRLGAFAMHGVKTQECLEVILEANKVREAAALVAKHGGKVDWGY